MHTYLSAQYREGCTLTKFTESINLSLFSVTLQTHGVYYPIIIFRSTPSWVSLSSLVNILVICRDDLNYLTEMVLFWTEEQ